MASHAKKKKSKSMHEICPMPAVDLDYRARSDMETLRRADEIRQDGKRLSAARKCAADDMKALQNIAKK